MTTIYIAPDQFPWWRPIARRRAHRAIQRGLRTLHAAIDQTLVALPRLDGEELERELLGELDHDDTGEWRQA